ncbi:hypothetical protein I0C86_41190 [Plantactinospora sp. S1510]|uniref:Uncharacterized protein n=1 Tax=Plantactinospora alkalitolerans TaxID=2789879 RepID=A0ABS0H9W4_9ACTN|nr:hypothetical protein [Plantactinospora alkalitolerans]MBF9135268.1 hypothetical protein [Plantactinospora alkalitolerans]
MTDTRPEVTPDSTPAEIDARLVELAWAMAREMAVLEAKGATPDQQAEAELAYARLEAESEPLELAYARRQWPRWYWVPNGHIHREYKECNTLWPSTERNLYPAASDMTGEQVVVLRGWHVCTVCVPAAPTLPAFRTPGTAGVAEQEASGDCPNRTPVQGGVDWRRAYVTGSCECGARGVSITPLGYLRKHPHERKKLDADQKARIEDPKLIGAPDGSVLRVDGEVIRTVVTAQNNYVRYMEYAATWGNTAAENRAHAKVIAEALAAKAGVTVEEIVARLQPRVDRKVREYNRT